MPYNVPTEFTRTARAQTNQPINLFTVFDYDGLGSNLYYAAYKTNIIFDGIEYSKFPITVEALMENTEGEIDAIQVRISNILRVPQFYLENYDLRGKKVVIKQVWADQLDDTDNCMEYVYYIDKYTSNEKAVVFDCSSPYDVLDVMLPFGVFMRGVCRWKKYKGPECMSDSSESECNRTMADCRARNNIARFGAFPSTPTQRVFVS